MKLPDHTSAAQLSTYAACPKKYRLRYLERAKPEFRSVSLALGTVVHSGIEWWFEQRLAGRKPRIEEAEAIVPADFAAATEGEVRWGKWTPPDLRDHATRLVTHFLERHGDLPVRAVEARFTLELVDPETGEVMPRRLLGFFDLLLGPRGAVELKTARSDWDQFDVASNIQVGAYLTAMEAYDIADTLDVLVLVKNRKPRTQELRLAPRPEVKRWFLESASAIERAIHAGHFPPAPGRGCANCEYQKRCLGQVLDVEAA